MDLTVWLIFLIYHSVNFLSCIAKTVLTQLAVSEQLSRLIVSTGFLTMIQSIIAALLALAALASGNKGDEKHRGEQ